VIVFCESPYISLFRSANEFLPALFCRGRKNLEPEERAAQSFRLNPLTN
jgi:hypothetical protein